MKNKKNCSQVGVNERNKRKVVDYFIFNQSFNTGKFPSSFKLAKVVPAFKNGNSTDLNNYRPISLLNTFSKILESAMHKRILSFLNRNHALSEFQFGFRPNYSTSLAYACLIRKLIKYFSASKLALTAFFDLNKVFDTLYHRILRNKLQYIIMALEVYLVHG